MLCPHCCSARTTEPSDRTAHGYRRFRCRGRRRGFNERTGSLPKAASAANLWGLFDRAVAVADGMAPCRCSFRRPCAGCAARRPAPRWPGPRRSRRTAGAPPPGPVALTSGPWASGRAPAPCARPRPPSAPAIRACSICSSSLPMAERSLRMKCASTEGRKPGLAPTSSRVDILPVPPPSPVPPSAHADPTDQDVDGLDIEAQEIAEDIKIDVGIVDRFRRLRISRSLARDAHSGDPIVAHIGSSLSRFSEAACLSRVPF